MPQKAITMETRVLVLTSFFMPIQIMSWRDAITDLYLGKVESVVDYNEEIRSPSVTMKLPAVVRILRKTSQIKHRVKFSKSNICNRDGSRCQYCLSRLPISKLTYDHVFPRSRGGETTWNNVVCACKKCNSKKADKTPEEAGMQLHTVPRQPNSLPVEPLRIYEKTAPEQWLAFLAFESN